MTTDEKYVQQALIREAQESYEKYQKQQEQQRQQYPRDMTPQQVHQSLIDEARASHQRYQVAEEARKATEKARELYKDTMAGKAGDFASDKTRREYDDASKMFFDAMKNPDSPAGLVGMALIRHNNIAANAGKRLEAIERGGVIVVTPREADSLEDLGCTLKVYVDKTGAGMVNIYDKNGKLIAKVTEGSGIKYVEGKAKEQNVAYDRWRHGKPQVIQEIEYQQELKKFLEENERIGTNTGVEEYVSKDEMETMKKQEPELYEILKKQGREAYEKAFNRKYESIGGTYLLKDDVNKLYKEDNKLYWILANEGYDAYLDAIKRRKNVEQYLAEQRDKRIAQLKDDDPYLYNILKTKGYEAYLEAAKKRGEILNFFTETMEQIQKDRDKALDDLSKYKEGDNYDLAGYFQDNPDVKNISKLRQAGFNELEVQQAFDYAHGLEVLNEYKNKDDTYDLLQALKDASRINYARNEKEYDEAKELMDAIHDVFSSETIADVRRKYLPALELPEDESTWTEAQKLVAPIAATAGYARSSPIPQDDALAFLLIGVATIGAATYLTLRDIFTKSGSPNINAINKAYRDLKLVNPLQVATLKKWIEESGGSANVENVAVVSGSGDSMKATFVNPKTMIPLAGLTPLIVPKVETGKEGIVPPKVKGAGSTLTPPVIKQELERIIGQKPEMVILITPKTDLSAYTRLLQARARVAVAERDSQDSQNSFNDILRDINAAGEVDEYIRERAMQDTSQQAANDAVRLTIKEFNEKYNIGQHRKLVSNYINDYFNYLRQMAIYDNARQQYIASLYPKPIGGKANQDMLSVLAGSVLIRDLKKVEEVSNKKTLAEVLNDELEPIIKKGLAIYESVYKKELQKGKAITAAQLKADTALKNAIETEVKQALALKEATETGTRAAIKSAVKAATKELSQVQAKAITKTAIATDTLTGVMTRSAIGTQARVAEQTMKRTRPLLLGDSEDDKKKRQLIRQSIGAITYRRGELKGKDVWHTYHIDREGGLNKSIVLGATPVGAVVHTGKGSTKTTLRRIRGKKLPNFSVISDTGAVDDIISVQGGKLMLSHVPDRISGGGARITSGSPVISGLKGRITPKMPKLR